MQCHIENFTKVEILAQVPEGTCRRRLPFRWQARERSGENNGRSRDRAQGGSRVIVAPPTKRGETGQSPLPIAFGSH